MTDKEMKIQINKYGQMCQEILYYNVINWSDQRTYTQQKLTHES